MPPGFRFSLSAATFRRRRRCRLRCRFTPIDAILLLLQRRRFRFSILPLIFHFIISPPFRYAIDAADFHAAMPPRHAPQIRAQILCARMMRKRCAMQRFRAAFARPRRRLRFSLLSPPPDFAAAIFSWRQAHARRHF
jgi:hypothetical protein